MRRGFTLVELIITLMILVIGVTSTFTMLSGMAQQGTDAGRQTLALELGRLRMEEILSKRFDENTLTDLVNCSDASLPLGLNGTETVDATDDVDDLHNWEGTLTGDPLQGTGLQTRVLVHYVNPSSSGFGTLADVGLRTCYKRITVDVRDQKTSATLVTLRTMATPFK